MHDLVVESCSDIIKDVPQKIYPWFLSEKGGVEPDDSAEILADFRKVLVMQMSSIQHIAKTQGKKFIVTDEVSLRTISIIEVFIN